MYLCNVYHSRQCYDCTAMSASYVISLLTVLLIMNIVTCSIIKCEIFLVPVCVIFSSTLLTLLVPYYFSQHRLQSDFDDPNNYLIGVHGYCTQVSK